MTSKERKEQYEIAIGEQFLDALQCERRFMGHGKDAGEPDLIYAIEGQTVGVEIATIYCDDGQAEVEWKLARGEIKRDPPRWVVTGSWIEPDKRFFARMRQELDDKCAKTYSGVETMWLCMKMHYGLLTVSEAEQMIAALDVPAHQYQRIYLGFLAPIGDGGGFRVFTLFEGSDR
jgi:hypothetical protein